VLVFYIGVFFIKLLIHLYYIYIRTMIVIKVEF